MDDTDVNLTVSTTRVNHSQFPHQIRKVLQSHWLQVTFNYLYVDPGPDDISYDNRRYFALNVSYISKQIVPISVNK